MAKKSLESSKGGMAKKKLRELKGLMAKIAWALTRGKWP
jgi:hypothetical protein